MKKRWMDDIGHLAYTRNAHLISCKLPICGRFRKPMKTTYSLNKQSVASILRAQQGHAIFT